MLCDEEELRIEKFLFLGNPPGNRLKLEGFPSAKNTKGNNAQGTKKELPNLKVVPRGRFEGPISMEEIAHRLFGAAPQRVAGLHQGVIQASDDFDAPLPEDFWLGRA